ncbi:MAG: fused MFS/spermidine synthase [Deltaproteobacteria bacterium]|nr:fused MFS/spermidine synthase [Deltaproteobacteria bacterium]
MSRDRSFPLLLLCFFLSGAAALVYETAWTREFAFVFGTSDLAVATVLAAYMGGLAAGAALAGRLAPRIDRPVLVYGLLELGIALYALIVPALVSSTRFLYVAFFGGQGAIADAGGGLTTALFYLVCSFVILLVPTSMMGATLPLLARHAVSEDRQIGGRIGLLYGINTAGAVAGLLVAAFLLLPEIGLRATIWVGASINGVVFLGAWALARRAPAPSPEPAGFAAGESGRQAWILPLILASGAVSFVYEVLWVRLLVHLVGSSVDAFATMLGAFLCGIALGSALASRLAKNARQASLGFALAQLGIAGLSLAAFRVVDRLPALIRSLDSQDIPHSLANTASCMLTLFPAALCIGATFPLAVRILARGGEDAGPASARVYSMNTVGSILGSVGAGFFLIPVLGFAGSMAACVAVNLILAASAALFARPRRIPLAVIACAGIIALWLLPPRQPWNVLRTTQYRGWAAGRPVHLGIGRSGTILLAEQTNQYRLWTNGLPESGIIKPGTFHNRFVLTRWLVSLPVLARPDTRSMLIVGLGGGAALEIVPAAIERIDVVELEPEVLAANRAVADRRWRDPLKDPRVAIHLNDARNALLLAESGYDAIVSQPSHPWAGGAAHLYTQEFFELVRSRLTEDGVFVQWIGLSYVDEELFSSLLAALDAVFPHVQVYTPPPWGGSVLFLASAAPLDLERTAARAIEADRADFDLIGIRSPEEVMAGLVLDEAGVEALSEGAPPNRDGHNRLQARSENLGERSLNQRLFDVLGEYDPLTRSQLTGESLFFLLRSLPAARAERIAESLADPNERGIGLALAGMTAGKREGPRALLREALAEAPRNEEARAAMLRLSVGAIAEGTEPSSIVAEPFSEAEEVMIAGWRARRVKDSGESLRSLEPELAAIPYRHPLATDATRLRIDWRVRSGEEERLLEAARLAEGGLGQWPDVPSLLLRASTTIAVGEYAIALDALGMLSFRPGQGGHLATLSATHLRHARKLLQSIPRSPELAQARRKAEKSLGLLR